MHETAMMMMIYLCACSLFTLKQQLNDGTVLTLDRKMQSRRALNIGLVYECLYISLAQQKIDQVQRNFEY